jgi:hypothetical protein
VPTTPKRTVTAPSLDAIAEATFSLLSTLEKYQGYDLIDTTPEVALPCPRVEPEQTYDPTSRMITETVWRCARLAGHDGQHDFAYSDPAEDRIHLSYYGEA